MLVNCLSEYEMFPSIQTRSIVQDSDPQLQGIGKQLWRANNKLINEISPLSCHRLEHQSQVSSSRSRSFIELPNV